jgi:hypothetical protein
MEQLTLQNHAYKKKNTYYPESVGNARTCPLHALFGVLDLRKSG